MINRNLIRVLCAAFLIILSLSVVGFADSLLSAEMAQKLRVDVALGERFEIFYEYELTAEDMASSPEKYNRIMTRISYAHAGGDVHVFRVDFAGDGYPLNGSRLGFYIDADNNINTGRQRGTGVGSDSEISLSNRNVTDGSINLSHARYSPDGKSSASKDLTMMFVEGTSIYLRYDGVPKNKVGDEFVFRVFILSQGIVDGVWSNVSRNSTNWDGQIVTVPVADRVYYIDDPSRTHFQDIIAFPNPFADEVRLAYNLPRAGAVNIAVYNESGEEVWSMSEDSLEIGYNAVTWDGYDRNGNRVSSGIYRCIIYSRDESGIYSVLYGTFVKAGN